MKYMFDNDVSILRRNLDGPGKLLDFPILTELAEQGMTDYFVIRTALSVRNDNAAERPDRHIGDLVGGPPGRLHQ